MKKPTRMARMGVISILSLVIAGCGDGGGPSTQPVMPGGTISGSVVKGPVSGARVCAYEVLATGRGREISCAISNIDGTYELVVEHRGPVIVEATGGTYVDEATGLPGVALAAPLSTMGEVAGSTTTLVATPLTTMAMNAAERSGTLSLAAFEGAAQQVKTAFGLGGDVDLARFRPDVSPGSADAYGRALVGLSRMLKAGASLPQVLAATDYVAIKAAFEHCSWVGPDPVVEIVSGTTMIARPGGPNALIDVFEPTPAWRTTLPTTGPLGQTGCEVLENTADRVRMSCDPTTSRAAVTIRTGSAAANGTYVSTPTSSELTLAGARIVVSGGELLTGASSVLTIDAPNGTVQVGLYCQLTPAAAIVPPISGGGLILTNNIGAAEWVSLSTGSVSLSGGSLSINGTLQGPSPASQIMTRRNGPVPVFVPPGSATLSSGGTLSVSGAGQGSGVIIWSGADLSVVPVTPWSSSAGQIQLSQGGSAVLNTITANQDPVIGVLGSSPQSGQAAVLPGSAAPTGASTSPGGVSSSSP